MVANPLDLAVTLREMFIGSLLGSTFSVAVGLLFSRPRIMAKVMDPYIAAVNGIPRIALAPLFIIWFGIGELSEVIVARTMTSLLCCYGALSGVCAVDPGGEECLNGCRASVPLSYASL